MASEAQIALPIPQTVKDRIARLAAARHVHMATLVKPWVIERLAIEEAKEQERA